MEDKLFELLLESRGLLSSKDDFLYPSYDNLSHDPYLLPDMKLAVDRIVKAKERNELVFIYGDYDIDGLTATTILLEGLVRFGLRVESFIPNRFVDGYGMSDLAVRNISEKGANLIITVDCGSLSYSEIDLANDLGMDVIVTDHHSVGETMPAAVAVVNLKRNNHNYPFTDLAGCGVAFKLIQALQRRLDGLPLGQEKWLLDLVALGTICDVVELVGENRMNAYWGLRVMHKARRVGIRALAEVAEIDIKSVTARHLGFVFGPHLNAAGRLDTARLSLDLLTVNNYEEALEVARSLRQMNMDRRAEQDRITKEAVTMAEEFEEDPVLVLSDSSWSHGIIGIVAAKLLEKFQKPTFVLQDLERGESKGSARSYGDFSAVEGIRASDEWLIKGGGHKMAAGITLLTKNISNFRKSINDFYRSLNLVDQAKHLKPVEDIEVNEISGFSKVFLGMLASLEPYGHGNPEPVFRVRKVKVVNRRVMGSDGQHIKFVVTDNCSNRISLVGFNMSERMSFMVGDVIDVWINLIESEWRGNYSIEGRLLDGCLS